MENISTDTQSNRASKEEIDYWLTIDRTNLELSDASIKYCRTRDILDSLGVNQNYFYILMFKLRRRLERDSASISRNG
jgi:uncharacterized protein YqjF (DUF2071 family)